MVEHQQRLVGGLVAAHRSAERGIRARQGVVVALPDAALAPLLAHQVDGIEDRWVFTVGLAGIDDPVDLLSAVPGVASTPKPCWDICPPLPRSRGRL